MADGGNKGGTPGIKIANPLREPLGRFYSLEEIPALIDRDPFKDYPNLTPDFAPSFHVRSIRARITSCSPTVKIFRTLQSMIHVGLEFRNPVAITNRSLRLQRLKMDKWKNAPTAISPPSALAIIGETGTGKSIGIESFLDRIPRWFMHAGDERIGLQRHLQIFHLVAAMKASRRAFCLSILQAFDTATKESDSPTNYFEKYEHTRIGPDILEVVIGRLCVAHNVGLLVIEEIQPKNFCEVSHLSELLLFFLNLLNVGIPTVFVANPLAFVGIEAFTQNLRRLTTEEPIRVRPFEEESKDWSERLSVGLWKHDPFEKFGPLGAEEKHQLFLGGGGIPGFQYRPIEWINKMLEDMPIDNRPEVGVPMIEKYRKSSMYLSHSRLIRGFAEKNATLLADYVDIPWESYAKKWGMTDAEIVKVGAEAEHREEYRVMGEDDEGISAYANVHKRIRHSVERKLKAEKAKGPIPAPIDPDKQACIETALMTMDKLKQQLDDQERSKKGGQKSSAAQCAPSEPNSGTSKPKSTRSKKK